MKMTALTRIRKGGEIINPGDTFDARTSGEARGLKALGRATEYIEPANVLTPHRMAESPDDREPLWARATELGVEIDKRWGVERLNEEIVAAERRASRRTQTRHVTAEPESKEAETPTSGHYSRRDMRADKD